MAKKFAKSIVVLSAGKTVAHSLSPESSFMAVMFLKASTRGQCLSKSDMGGTSELDFKEGSGVP